MSTSSLTMMTYHSECYLCGKPATDHHHIFNGALRNKSEKFGAVICVCRECHNAIHNDIKLRKALKKEFQIRIMSEYGMTEDEFRSEFYKNYL